MDRRIFCILTCVSMIAAAIVLAPSYDPAETEQIAGDSATTDKPGMHHRNTEGPSEPAIGAEPGNEPSLGPTYEYVIITTNDIVANSEELDHFVNLKEFMGHSVKVVTESDYDVLIGQPPNDRAERIRQWLVDNYVAMGIQYVLLVGDPDPDNPFDPADTIGDIPMKMFWPGYFSRSGREYPSDYFYAELEGNWDLDGDQIYDEGAAFDAPESPDLLLINTDYFSVRWTGYMLADFNEEYELNTFSDGGVRMYLDGSLVIDNWDDLSEHAPTNDYYMVTLTAGLHELTLEYKEHTDEAIIKLYYRTNVAKGTPNYIGRQIIPLDHLRDETDSANGLTGRYYNNIFVTDPPDLVKASGEVVNFAWGTGDVGPGGPETDPEVSVGRIPVYDANYTQLDKILWKIIRYETDPGDISWRKSILLPMTELWPGTPATDLAEGIRNDYALAAGFDVFRCYDEDYGPVGGPTPELWPTTPDNVKTEWKKGYGMVTWDTHGGATSAQHMFDSSLAPELDDTKPSFVYMTACSNGQPEHHDNLGYAVLKNGGIATYSATRVSYGAGMPWTFDPTSAVNHNLAYFTTRRVINDGVPKSAGDAMYLTKADVPEIGANLLNYNLYGDTDTYLLTTLPNYPPVASVAGPIIVNEGETMLFDASGSYDPEGDPLEYRWDLDNDGNWDTSWSTSATATLTLGDDYMGEAMVEVRDELGLTGSDVVDVTVLNVDPTIENTKAYILVDFTLRAAGEKWHNLEMYIYADGTQIGYAEVVRYPGSPDDQSQTLVDVECDVTKVITVKVVYTPLDDPVNGQVWGASPVWVNVSFEDGGYNLTQHNFNVKHPERWEWILGVNQFFVGHDITFEADATDPGSDDLTFTWNWDDLSPDDVAAYYNDGVGPDPYPSTDGTYPFAASDARTHAFMAADTYNVTLTVTDDDGGLTAIVITIILV